MARLWDHDGYALLVWKNTREMEFSLKTSALFSSGIFWSPMASFPWTRVDRLATDHGFDEPFPIRRTDLRLFLHAGTGPLLSILLVFHYSAPLSIANRWMGGWTSFFSTSQRFRRTSTFDGTLVFNDCMEWVNIPRWGVYRLGGHGQKIRFPFILVTAQMCPIVAIKRGLAGRDQQRFPYSGLRLKLTFPSSFLFAR